MVFSVDASSTGAGSISTTTVTGNTSTATLTVTTAGTIVLDANQAADANYLAAPQVQEVLVVNQATQTIAFTPVTTATALRCVVLPHHPVRDGQHPGHGRRYQ